MINCLIVEDEPLAQQVISDNIDKIPELSLLGICGNAVEAYEFIHRNTVDLIFLDIQMPVLTGMDFIKSLKDPPAVIFTTAFIEYAASSYEVAAIDYLVKPVTFDRFKTSIQKFLKMNTPPKHEKEYTFFKVNGNFVKLMHVDILYAQSIKDYIILYTLNGNYITHMTMKNLDELLPSDKFLRIHRSFLVNRANVTSVGKKEIQIGEDKLPIGKNYKDLQFEQFTR